MKVLHEKEAEHNKQEDLQPLFLVGFQTINTLCLGLATITKSPQAGGLKQHNLFLTGLEAGNSKIRCQIIRFSVSTCSWFADGQTPSFCVLTPQSELFQVLLTRALIPS